MAMFIDRVFGQSRFRISERLVIATGLIATILVVSSCADDLLGNGPTVVSVTVSPELVTLTAISDTTRLSAIARDADGNVLQKDFEWSSSIASVATVSASGLVTAAANGVTPVSAVCEGVAGSAEVTVAQVAGTVSISPTVDTLRSLGSRVTLTVSAADANGHTLENVVASWYSSDSSVATVQNGLVVAVGNGSANITATVDGAEAISIVVVRQRARYVSISPWQDTITAVADTTTFTATAFDAGGNVIPDAEFSWISSDSTVATVSLNGRVTAVANGTANITATVDSASNDGTVVVSQVVADITIEVPPTDVVAGVSMDPAVQITLRDANGYPAEDATAAVTIGNNPGAGTLFGRTTVTAGSGMATFPGLWIDKVGSGYSLSFTADGASVTSTTFTVSVAEPSHVLITPGGAALATLGATEQLVARVVDRFSNLLPDTFSYSWTSLNTRVTSVGPTGLVTANGIGQASVRSQATAELYGHGLITVAGGGGPATSWIPFQMMSYGIVSIWGTADDDIFAVGYNNRVSHFDGSTWTRMNTGVGRAAHLRSVWGRSSDDVYAVGEAGLVLHYDGQIWDSTWTGTWLEGVWGSAADDLFAVGRVGTIIHNSGDAWYSMESGTTKNLHDVWGSGPRDVYAVGAEGTLLHYTGTEWERVPVSGSYHLNAIWGFASDDIYAVGGPGYGGGAGVLLHFDGTNWSPTAVTFSLADVWGASSSDMYIVGGSGRMYHIGESMWTSLESRTQMGLTAIWGTASNSVWVGGGGYSSAPILRGTP